MSIFHKRGEQYLYQAACFFFVLAFFLSNITSNFTGETTADIFYQANRAFRIVAYLLCALKLSLFCKTSKRRWVLLVAVGILGLVALVLSDNFMVIDAILLMFCATGQNYDKDYRILATAIFAVIAIVFLLCAFSVIPFTDWGIEGSTRGWRYSLGLGHPNTLGYFTLYGIWFWMYCRFRKWSWIDVLIPIWLTAMMWAISKSRASILAIFLTALLLLFYKLPKIQNLQSKVGNVLVFSPLICAPIGFLAVWFYKTNDVVGSVMNRFFSGRLWLYSHFLEKSPFSLLGYTPENNPELMEMRKYGRESLMPLDNIYMKTYIYFGLVFLLILLALWVYALRRAYLAGNIPLLIIGVVSAIYGVVEPTQMNVLLSPILLSAFALYPGAEENSAVPVYSFWALFKPGTWKKAHE